jgi:hypothetical protein
MLLGKCRVVDTLAEVEVFEYAERHGRALKSIHPVDKMMARAIAGFLMECSFFRRGVAHAGGCMVQCAPDGDQVEGR